MMRYRSIAMVAVLSLALDVGSLLGGGPAAARFKLLDQVTGQASGLIGSMGGGKSLGSTALTNQDIAAGLKEALRVGSERVVAELGRADGFAADPDIHIPLPPTLAKMQKALKGIGMSGLADDLELRLNRAAEAATPKAKAIFWKAIESLTLDDVKAIYNGPDDAATRYFRRATGEPLKDAMRPIVDRGLSQVGALAAYDAAVSHYRSIPFVPDVKADLNGYVLGKALDGIFLYLAREEAAIRRDPLKRTTDLLVRVFGAGK